MDNQKTPRSAIRPDRLASPYWSGHQYSAHPHDCSNALSDTDFRYRMQDGFERVASLMTPKGHLVILIGDGRKNGVFSPMHSTLIHVDLLPLEVVLIKEGDHERRVRHVQYGPTPFILTLHQYVLIFQGPIR